MNKQALNDFTDGEVQLIYLVRKLKTMGSLKVSKPKADEIRFELLQPEVISVKIEL